MKILPAIPSAQSQSSTPMAHPAKPIISQSATAPQRLSQCFSIGYSASLRAAPLIPSSSARACFSGPLNERRGYSLSTTPLRRQPFSRSTRLDPRSAFTLLEVIIACAIFFMVAFAILGVVTQGLAAARAMQIKEPDAGVVAAMISTNKQMLEGTLSGDFDDFFPDLYPGYTWQADMYEVSSNSLFQVDITVFSENRKRGPSESKMSLLMFVPGSPPGSASKAR